MRAVTTTGNSTLEIREHPDPAPGPGDVLVRVSAAGLNRADLLQRAGFYPAPPGSPPDIPGLEFCGEVVALGSSVATRRLGEFVFGICGGGGQAELLVVPAEHCVPIRPESDPMAMGAIPEAYVTAHDALITQCRAQPGEWVLVHAAGSGVGTAAVQLASAWGCRVIGTARSADKLERCRSLGLDHGLVPPRTDDGDLDVRALTAMLRDITGGGVDVTLDLVGGDYVTADILASAPRGRVSLIGTLAGGSANLPILAAMQQRLQITGTVLRPRSRADKAAAMQAFERDVVPLLDSGRVAPVIERIIPAADVVSAYDLLATDSTFGKLVLDLR